MRTNEHVLSNHLQDLFLKFDGKETMSSDLKFWGITYLTVGLVLLLVARLLVKMFYKDKRSAFVKEMMNAIENDKSQAEKRRKFFKNIAVGGLAIAVWPLTFTILVNELRDSRRNDRSDRELNEKPEFICKSKDLLEIVNALEVEANSKILDPMGRVPDLPFGHLNKGWLRLRRKVRPGDVMWSFKTSGITPSFDGRKPRYNGPQNVVSGFAIVRNKQIVAEFLSQWD